MKKNILIVIASLGCGGAEKSLISFLPLLDYNKYSIDLLIQYKQHLFFENLVYPRVHLIDEQPFVHFCKRPIIKCLFPTRILFLISRLHLSIACRLKKNKSRHPDEVYWECCHKAFYNVGKKYDVAIAWGQGHATHFVAEKTTALKKYSWINADYSLANHERNFDKRFYDQMDGIVAVSDRLAEILYTTFPEYRNKISVIYDLINADIIKKMAEEPCSFPGKKALTILTVGRLEPPKGYSMAVEACTFLKNQGLEFKWYAIGEGSQRTKLEKSIHDAGLDNFFALLGEKTNPYPYMQQADIYVQPSVFEGYCLTLAEARILNKPIVATNFDVVFDQIQDGENGLIVEKSGEAIAKGVLRLIQDPDLRDHLINTLEKEKKGNIEEAEKLMALFEQ